VRKREIATLAFELIALYVALGFVNLLGSVLANAYYFSKDGRLDEILPFLMPAAAAFAVALLV
jgi:zinc transporter ZupT